MFEEEEEEEEEEEVVVVVVVVVQEEEPGRLGRRVWVIRWARGRLRRRPLGLGQGIGIAEARSRELGRGLPPRVQAVKGLRGRGGCTWG